MRLRSCAFALLLVACSPVHRSTYPIEDEAPPARDDEWEGAARSRAESEFKCARDAIHLEALSLGPHEYDVTACGHVARYACVSAASRNSLGVQCVREPDPQ